MAERRASKSGPDRVGPAHDHLGGELAVQGPGEAGTVEGDGRQVHVDDLPAGVHAGVGAACAGDVGRLTHARRALERLAQRAGDRRDLGLHGEAPEGRTVVGDQEPPALLGSAGGLLHP